jgi:hypothetical protein
MTRIPDLGVPKYADSKFLRGNILTTPLRGSTFSTSAYTFNRDCYCGIL